MYQVLPVQTFEYLRSVGLAHKSEKRQQYLLRRVSKTSVPTYTDKRKLIKVMRYVAPNRAAVFLTYTGPDRVYQRRFSNENQL